MFAILETGGKQYKVEAGDIIEVESIDQSQISKDNTVDFDQVLLIQDRELVVGQPFVKDGHIQAKILEESKSPKVIIFKKKSKKGYRRTRGHRQHLHRIQIEKIEIKKTDKTEKNIETTPKASATVETRARTVKKVAVPRKKPEAGAAGKKTAASSRKTTAAKNKEK